MNFALAIGPRLTGSDCVAQRGPAAEDASGEWASLAAPPHSYPVEHLLKTLPVSELTASLGTQWRSNQSLRLRSPQNGNICEFSWRLLGVWPLRRQKGSVETEAECGKPRCLRPFRVLRGG